MKYKARKVDRATVVTIPQYMVDILKINAGDLLNIELKNKQIIIRKEEKEND